MAATIAPRATRKHAVQAIVALELLFDYLDGLTERPHADPLGEGERLYAAFVAALDPRTASTGGLADTSDPQLEGREQPLDALGPDDYAQELGQAVRRSLAQLPASEAIAPFAMQCAARGAQAQIRMHATPMLGTGSSANGRATKHRDNACSGANSRPARPVQCSRCTR